MREKGRLSPPGLFYLPEVPQAQLGPHRQTLQEHLGLLWLSFLIVDFMISVLIVID